jgi:hypothetical protein
MSMETDAVNISCRLTIADNTLKNIMALVGKCRILNFGVGEKVTIRMYK